VVGSEGLVAGGGGVELRVLRGAPGLVRFAIFLPGISSAQLARDRRSKSSRRRLPNSSSFRDCCTDLRATEFYFGISNRISIVLVAPEALHGWKVCGPVTNRNCRSFEVYQEGIKDPGFPRDLSTLRRLAGLRGGFTFPNPKLHWSRQTIASNGAWAGFHMQDISNCDPCRGRPGS